MALNFDVVIVARQALCDVFFTMSKFNAGESLHSERTCKPTYQQIRLSTSTRRATSLRVFEYIYFHLSTLYLQLYVSLSVCHTRRSNVAHIIRDSVTHDYDRY